MSTIRGIARRLWELADQEVRWLLSRNIWPRLKFWPRLKPRFLRGAVLTGLVLLALVERARTSWRRLRGARPRLIWGPSAILNNKYWSAAMRSIGYESRTVIAADSGITRREDWDVCRDDFLGDSPLAESLRTYAMFASAMRHGDVFMFYFDGGYLRFTGLEWIEFRLLRLAGKKLVFSPYGGDIAVLGHLGSLEEPLLADYPELPEISDLLERRVLHSLRWADVSMLTMQPGFQPWFNVLWANQLAIDTELWRGNGSASERDGRNGAVSIVHAPNHRQFKGTEHLERAVETLRGEGLSIDLRILEGLPNEQVRSIVRDSDIVADQFLAGWGLFAVEGMAAGKPVLSNLESIPALFKGSADVRECPIVDTSPASLTDDLRRLVTSPNLRDELGRASLDYVRRYHSYEAVAEGWRAVVEFVWRGTPLPRRFQPPVVPERVPATLPDSK